MSIKTGTIKQTASRESSHVNNRPSIRLSVTALINGHTRPRRDGSSEFATFIQAHQEFWWVPIDALFRILWYYVYPFDRTAATGHRDEKKVIKNRGKWAAELAISVQQIGGP